jgi:phosphatidylinositol alpha 1,6-mannosyltransferase
LNAYRRVAFLPDTFHEINGVAHTSRQLEQYVRRQRIPFLSVHAAETAERIEYDPVTVLQLRRSRFSFPLDTCLKCDPFLLRYAPLVIREAKRMNIELVHITGPGDMGVLGWYVAWRLRLPLVMGWHTNLHEYAGKRLHEFMRFFPPALTDRLAGATEEQSLAILSFFYRRAHTVLAPNQELLRLMRNLTGRPCELMQRGVDTQLFTPARRNRSDGRFRIGYVGRLTPEKNVAFLADLGKFLLSAERDFEFHIIGQGSECAWLQAHVPHAVCPGVLTGETLARAYANMDLFVFPSTTDTFGNVILEALASGVPCVVTAQGGPKFLVQSAVTGYIAADFPSFIRCVHSLMEDPATRRQMSEAARQYARGLSWNAVFEKLFRTYDNYTAPCEELRKVPVRNRLRQSA